MILTNLIERRTSNLFIPDPEVEELLQRLANRAALHLALQVMDLNRLRFGLAVAKAV